jgi:hypothetical protein
MKAMFFSLRKTVATALLTVAFAGISIISLAEGHGPVGDRGPNAGTAELRYIAGKDGEVLFNVIYNNASGARFSVIVLDEYGNQLYQNYFSDKQFDRKFKLADPESTNKLTFIIRDYGDNSVQRFQVDASNRLIEDVEVKEVR